MSSAVEIRDLNRSIHHLLRRAGQFAADLYVEEVGPRGLTQRQFAVLLTVAQNENLSQARLVELTGIDRSTLADLVARMIGKGLLLRRAAKDDARAKSVRISAAGRRALQSAQPGAASADKRLLGLLPSPQRKELLGALRQLSEALDRHEGDGANGAATTPAPARSSRPKRS